MPFTPSHAVVALPFLRTPLVPAAIAIGAMAPDLPLYVRFTPLGYAQTHSFAWLPLTAALALVLLVVWRCALRPAAGELSPDWLAPRLPAGWDAGIRPALRETFPSALGILWLAISLALGVASHIAWDLVTHEGRAGIAALDAAWGPLPVYKWLQHGSGVLGLAILAVWAILWLRRADAAAGPTRAEAPRSALALWGGRVGTVPRVLPAWMRRVWWASLPVLLLVVLAVGYAQLGPFRAGFGLEHLAYRVLPPACAAWGVLTLALCIAVQIVRTRRWR